MQYDKKNNIENIKVVFSLIYKIFINILSIIALIVIVFVIIYLYQLKVQNKIYVNMFGYTILEVKSGSMEKAILIGDLVVVELFEKSEKNEEENKNKNLKTDINKEIKDNLQINDIITFKKENNLITHRIIILNEDHLITKGDANNSEDKPISYNDVIGKIIHIIPNVGIWKKVLLEKQVFIPLSSGIILLVTAILIDTEENKEEKKEVNEKKRKKIQKGKRFKE